MKITLIRHAEVEKFYIGKYNGHIDIALSENGKDQAKKLGKKIRKMHFDKIYCSDLLRAKQTLALFKLHQEVIYSDQLREKSWGRHEGMSFDDITKEGIKYKNFEQWLSDLDGEDVLSYINRIKHYFNNTIFKNNGKNILIITHSGVIKTLLSIINNTSIEESFKISIPYSSRITFSKRKDKN